MDCESTSELLDGYLDGELDLVRSLEVERHLQDCPSCGQFLARRLSLRRELASAALYHPAPVALQERVRAALHRMEVVPRLPRSIKWRRLAAVGGIAAVLLIAFGIAARRRAPSRADMLAHDVIASHVRSLLADHLADVASNDRHTVKPWFNGSLDFSPWVGDLADEGFPLVGGRLDYLDGRSVAALVYRRRKHVINLFEWPASGGDSTAALERQKGYQVLHWTAEGMNWWAISDLNAQELDDFGQLVRARSAQRSVPQMGP